MPNFKRKLRIKSYYKNDCSSRVWVAQLAPLTSKQDRASQQSPKFERGEVYVPNKAPWLDAFLAELVSFPHGKHDDQVDSVVQFLAAIESAGIGSALQAARRC